MAALIRLLYGALLLAALLKVAVAQEAGVAVLTGRRAAIVPLDPEASRALGSEQRAARVVLEPRSIAPGEQLILRAELLEAAPAEREISVEKWSAEAAIVAFFEPLQPGKMQTAYLHFPARKGAAPPRAVVIGIVLANGAAPLSALALEGFEVVR